MFDFAKICKKCERLSPAERGIILAEKSVKVFASMYLKDIDLDPKNTLAAFIIGSVVSDGRINKKEYFLIYPALVKVFGEDFDFDSVKEVFEKDKDGREAVIQATEGLMRFFSIIDEEVKTDLIEICLLVTSIDGKISLKERRYIKKLLKA